MSDPQSAKIDKLSAARRKLKEFQEQKKLREQNRASPNINNENIGQFTPEHQQQLPTSTNHENIAPPHHNGNNVNIAQYFLPTTQTPETSVRNDQHQEGFYNQPFYNVQDSFQTQQNSNHSVNIQAYFSDNLYQSNHTLGHENLNPEHTGTNVQNSNKSDNFNSYTNQGNNESNSYQNVFHQHVGNIPSFETNQNSTIPTNDNTTNVSDTGNGTPAKDLANTNYNILSVFTDSSTSSHTSSTHTGPFLLNEESPIQNNEISQPAQEKGGNGYTPGNSNENYHLFEQNHNENYFGINFGNDQGPGIHLDINPFEHRNEKLVSDFLECESRPEQKQPEKTDIQESSPDITSSESPLFGSSVVETPLNTNTPINLLNDTFRRNLMSLSTSKSTSVEEYTDKSTRGNSTVSKSVSLESSTGGGGERGDELMGKDSTNSSTVFSSCDNLRKLLSSTAESSSEPPCTNSQCEEACVFELEKKNEELRCLLATEQEKNGDLRALLTGEQGKTSGLEAQINQMRHELQSFHSNQTDSLKHYAQESDHLHTKIKSQTHTIQILIEEKTQMEEKLKSLGELVEEKGKENEELKGRLAISKHKCANIERDVGVLQDQVKKSSTTITELNDMLTQERKQLEDLAEDKTALIHKLDTKSQQLQQTMILLQERDSQLSLMHLKVQQLSAANGMFSSNELNDVQSLQQERDQLRASVTELNEQLKTLTRERDKTLQYHGHMIDTLKAKNEELTSVYTSLNSERSTLHAQCESQVSRIADLEKQLQTLRSSLSQESSNSDDSALKTLVAEMETKVKELTLDKQRLDTSLQAQVLETELAQERVDQLTREMERLEADKPDANALLSAMESDKIAASRAVQQNSILKQQLQELQDAMINLNNSKLEISELLIQEQNQAQQLRDTLESLQNQLNQQTALAQQLASSQNDNVENGVEVIRKHEPIDQNALTLLEDKFNAAMKSVAELSDEKQRLEYLVTQLQLETETIGEYAALYQKQRYLLQQKAREKDEQVKQLSEDQEALKQKLAKLNALVQDFVTQGTVNVTPETADTLTSLTPTTTSPPVETKASQIMELISEIEANRLVVPSSFHPCPVCSGQLITV